MDYKELIMERRSLRGCYNGTPVSKEIVESIIADAQKAPSWKNSQNARYYAAVTPEAIEKIKACLPSFNQKNSEGCGAYIVTSFVKGLAGFDTAAGVPVNELGDMWGAYDLGLNNAYLVLAAADKGVDSLIMGIRDEKALREACGIPETEMAAAVIALGKGDKKPSMPPRKELQEVARFI